MLSCNPYALADQHTIEARLRPPKQDTPIFPTVPIDDLPLVTYQIILSWENI